MILASMYFSSLVGLLIIVDFAAASDWLDLFLIESRYITFAVSIGSLVGIGIICCSCYWCGCGCCGCRYVLIDFSHLLFFILSIGTPTIPTIISISTR